VNGLGFSALLLGRLGQGKPPYHPARQLRRLGWMLLAELVLFLALTVADRLPR
jgi:hypothetical protein